MKYEILRVSRISHVARLSDICSWSALFFLQCVDISERSTCCRCGKGSSLFDRCIFALESDWYEFEDLLRGRDLDISLEVINETRRSICEKMSNSMKALDDYLQVDGLDDGVDGIYLSDGFCGNGYRRYRKMHTHIKQYTFIKVFSDHWRDLRWRICYMDSDSHSYSRRNQYWYKSKCKIKKDLEKGHDQMIGRLMKIWGIDMMNPTR